MFITRYGVRYDLTANEMLETFCSYELSCDILYVDENCHDDENFVNNSATTNKLIFREIALDMRSLIEMGELNKREALQEAKEKYLKRVKESNLPIIDFVKEELCREAGSFLGRYKREKGEYIIENGHTRVTCPNPNTFLDCHLAEMSIIEPNNDLWNWAIQFLDEHR